jgi:hypothetical protein
MPQHKSPLDKLHIIPEIEALWAGMTTADEDAALEQSVVETGAVTPITSDQDGGIIDGLRLFVIYRKHNIRECWVTVLTDLTRQQKVELAISLNANRRHVSAAQKKDLVRKLLLTNPRLSGRYVAKVVGVDQKTAQKVKDEMVSGEEIPHLDSVQGIDGKVYKAKGCLTPLNEMTAAVSALAEVKDVPSVVPAKKVRRLRAQERREQAAEEGATMSDPAGTTLVHCRFQDLLERRPDLRGQGGALISDPPYADAWLPYWYDLGCFAREVLMPGALVVLAAGNGNYNHVLRALDDSGLTYVRTISVPFRVGGGFGQFGGLRWYGMHRPIAVYCHGSQDQCRIKRVKVQDRMPMRGPQKEWHDHQQHVEDFVWLVQRFSLRGDLIIDPCAGSFTTGEAVLRVGGGRTFLGCDVVEDNVNLGRYRLSTV